MSKKVNPNKYLWLVLALALVISACTTSGTDETSTTTAGNETTTTEGGEATTTTEGGGDAEPVTIVMSITQDESTLTPFTHVSSPTFLPLVWDRLMLTDENNELHPLIASDMQVSEDRTTYTFTLFEGMTFHDGEPLTAEDVVFSYEYQAEFGFQTNQLAIVESVEAPDDLTVVMTLSAPNSDFEHNVLTTISIIPKHLYEGVEDPTIADMALAVGSGPYAISDYVSDERYTLVANENYVPGTPKVDVIEMPIIVQPATAYSAILSGEIDMASVAVQPQLTGQFENAEGVGLLRGSSFSPELLTFNAVQPPFDQVEVRQAISQAIDTSELMEVVALGVATEPSAGFLHPESPLTTDPIDHVYDPEGAAQILDDLGAEVGSDGIRVLDGEPMSYTLLVDAARTDSVRSAELITGMLAEIGIEVVVDAIESQTLFAAVWPEFNTANFGEFEMTMFNWNPVLSIRAGRFGALVASDPARGTLNFGHFADEEVDALVAEMDSALDDQARLDAIQEITERIAELVPFITLYYPDSTYAYRNDVFDGWVYTKGLGPINNPSFVDYDNF